MMHELYVTSLDSCLIKFEMSWFSKVEKVNYGSITIIVSKKF